MTLCRQDALVFLFGLFCGFPLRGLSLAFLPRSPPLSSLWECFCGLCTRSRPDRRPVTLVTLGSLQGIFILILKGRL